MRRTNITIEFPSMAVRNYLSGREVSWLRPLFSAAWKPVFAGTFALFALFCSSAIAEPLRLLSVQPDGKARSDFAIKGSSIVCKEGQNFTPLPPNAQWQLSDDIETGSDFIVWSPTYSIEGLRNPPEGSEAFPFLSSITLRMGDLNPWPEEQMFGSLVVFGWLNDGKIVRLTVAPILHRDFRSDETVSRAEFLLSDNEKQGFPFVLLWRDGKFIAPNLWYIKAAANRALALMHARDQAAAIAFLRTKPELLTARSRFGSSLLHFAAESGRTAVVQYLLEKGANPLADPFEGARQPLAWASSKDRADAVKLMLTKVPRFAGRSWASTEMVHAIRDRHAATADVLRDYLSRSGSTPFTDRQLAMYALAADWPQLALDLSRDRKPEFLLNLPIKQVDSLVQNRSYRSIAFLISNGFSPASLPDKGVRLLKFAVQDGETKTFSAAIATGAAIDPEKLSITSPLSYAVRKEDRTALKRLVEAGADPLRRDSFGGTPLHAAIFCSDSRVALDLLAKSGHSVREEKGPRSALHLALLSWNSDVATALTALGAKIDLSAANARPALKAAVAMDLAPLISLAISDGWDPKQPIEGDWNLIDIATGYNARSVLKLKSITGAIGRFRLEENQRFETPPRPESIDLTAVTRREDRAWPEMTLTVEGVVLADGRFVFPKILNCGNLELTRLLADVANRWRFSPALSEGRAVSARTQLPMRFDAQPRHAFTVNSVESRPILISPKIDDADEVSGGEWVSVGELPMYNIGANILFSLGSMRPEGSSADTCAEFTVGEDGIPRNIQIVALPSAKSRQRAIDRVTAKRFVPAYRSGQAVACIQQEWFLLDR